MLIVDEQLYLLVRFDPHQNIPKSQFTFKPLLLFTIEVMRYFETTIGKPWMQ
jgi:hypothetical protein